MDERTILLKALPVSEKCFDDEHIADKKEQNTFTVLRNQRLTFQVAYAKMTADLDAETPAELRVFSPVKDFLTLYSVEDVPVNKPCYPDADDNYLRKQPGLFPDLMRPLTSPWRRVFFDHLHAFFVEFTVSDDLAAGTYPVTFSFYYENECIGSTSISVEVLDAKLPEQTLLYTNWFHNDCLATYYGVDIYSERHWEIIENFIREAVREGMNMILTPVLTPPLDTGRGWYRPDVGLVDIYKDGDAYSYKYDKLDRWIKLCEQCGIKRFEISHLFCQWSAARAPQVTAFVNGEKERIFGWDTDALSPEYTAFIRSFVKNLLEHLKSVGADKKCFFHISDEPNMAVYDSYCAAKNSVIDLFEGYPVIDALSDYEFYEKKQIKMPVPAITEAEPFLKHDDLPMRWTYYCCAQNKDVSNRFVAMPGQRTEILGVQLYTYRIDGFLQWGYNFYNAASSWNTINPFVDLSGDNWVPAGDTFVVYPAPNGTPYPSLHGLQFAEALTDLRLLQYVESLYGRAFVLDLIGTDITFREYPKDADYLINLKAKLYEAIKNKLN